MTNSEDMLLVGGMPVPSVVLFSDENTFGMSLGIIFLGTYLRKFNYSVDVFDPIIYYSKMYKKRKQAIPRKLTNIQRKKYTDSILELTHDRLKQILREKKFKIIGVSTSSLIDLDLRNMSIVREMQPDSLIIAGGPGLSLRPENVLAISEADIVVIGEGEIICKTLLDRIKKHDLKYPISKDDYDKYFSDIPFIACKVIEKNGINIYTSIANKDDYVKKYLPEVNKLPLPDLKLLDAHLKEHTQFMYTNRSCPSLCTFCSMASLKKKMSHDCGFGINTLMKRWMEPEKVIDWIIFLYNNCNNLRDISFNEDTFTYPIERAKRICKLIIKNKKSGKIGNDVTFFCQTRSNLIDEELLHLMKEAGFTQISYGAESGSNDMLKCIRKGFTTNDTLNAIDMTLESGLMPSINLILFLPKSKIHDCIKTIELAMYCYENGAIVETNDIIVPYYGTDIEMKYRNGNNIINNKIIGKTVFVISDDKKSETNLRNDGILLPERDEMHKVYNIYAKEKKKVLEKFFNDTTQWFTGWELISLSSIGILIYSLEKIIRERKTQNMFDNEMKNLKLRYNHIIEQQKEISSDFWYFSLNGKIVGLDKKKQI